MLMLTTKIDVDIYRWWPEDMLASGLDQEDLINAVGGRDALFDDGTYQVNEALCKKIKDNEEVIVQILNTVRYDPW